MVVFLSWAPARNAVIGPMEFFPSVDVALNEVKRRGRERHGRRALVADVHTFGAGDFHRAAQDTEFPDARLGMDGWVALVWWRRAGQPAPVATEPVGEVWLSLPDGKVDRHRINSGEWSTGKAWKLGGEA